jgi:hypothetical protein
MPRLLLLLAHAVALVMLLSDGAQAVANTSALPGCNGATRPCDALWVVSTRGLPCSNPQLHAPEMRFCELDESGEWRPSDLINFLGTNDPAVTTVFWVHGNRHSSSEARRQGTTIYRTLTRCQTCATPIRFVIFSWPSDRLDSGPLEDLRVKAGRTNAESYYLAWLIDQIDGNLPVSLAGYSFGARITTGAAHLLGGGILCGWTLEERANPNRLPMHAALLAPALDNHWLIPGHRHGNALSQLAHLSIIYNSCDAALKRYRFLYGRKSGAQALGHTGITCCGCLGAFSNQILQYDACSWVGRKHEWERYFDCEPIVSRVRRELIPE